MSDNDIAAEERDRNLVRQLCNNAGNLRTALHEWIQEELKEQRFRAQLIQGMTSGLIHETAKEYEKDLDELDHRRLPDAIKQQRTREQDVYSAFDDDPFADYMYLEESLFRLERMARMMFRMRGSLKELSAGEGPGDQAINGEDADDLRPG